MSDLGNKDVFAKNLKYYMKLNNVDRNKLSEHLGFKYSTLSDWINAETYPRIDKIEMLSNYFDIKKSDLIEEHSRDAIDFSILDNVLYSNKNKIDSVKNLPIEKQEIIANAVQSVLDMIDEQENN